MERHASATATLKRVGFEHGHACVFCGQPILHDDEVVGRGDGVAHVACADRALADDAHWDRIAEQSGEAEPEAEDEARRPAPAATTGRTGCVVLVALVALPAVAAIGMLTALA